MSTGVKSFIFLLLLPFFAGIGHDIYYNYFSDKDKIKKIERLQIDPEEFLISDAGWIWNTYAPDSMEIARDSISPETWKNNVDPILQLPSVVVGLFPLFIGGTCLLIAFVLGIWPFRRQGQVRKQKEEDFAVYKHAKVKSVKFSKK